MNFSREDIISICGLVSSGGLGVFSDLFSSEWPTDAKHFAFVTALLVALASVILKIYSTKANAPATTIVQDAPIVAAGTEVVHSTTDTSTLGTNVSTTSTAPIKAPAVSVTTIIP